MGITLKTRKMLWGRAANRCAFVDCRKELVIDASQSDDESLIGEECHIVARSPDGPRGQSPLTLEQRDKYANLVLLCAVHHKVIDDQPGQYTVDHLKQIKGTHENWVRETLAGFDPAKQRDDEFLADLIQEFCDRADIDNWQNWSSWVLGGGGWPQIGKDIRDSLDGMQNWLLSRVWPERYPEIKSSFQNFRIVLQDFLNVFSKHAERHGANMLATRRFYKIDEWDDEKYHRLLRQYEIHVGLVQDLMLELTRATNYIFDRIRERFFPTFRLREGVLLVTGGPYMDLSCRTYRCEYHGDERIERPYPGLEEFKSLRQHRDHCLGRGTQPEE